MKIRNTIHNPISNPIWTTVYKLNGKRKLWDSIYSPIRNAINNPINNPINSARLRRRRDADLRARLLTLQIRALMRFDVFRRVLAMKRTKIFDPTSSGSSSPWRTLNYLARKCPDFPFCIGLTKQEVFEMLSQVHRNLSPAGNLQVGHATGFHSAIYLIKLAARARPLN